MRYSTFLTLIGSLALLVGCPEQDDDDTGDEDMGDDDTGDDDTGDDDTGDDDTGDDDTGDDDTAGNPGPVRTLFLVDLGTSWQCTDPAGDSAAVLQQSVQDMLMEPTLSVGYVLYGAEVPNQAFTTNQADLDDIWNVALAMAPASDLQGALATAVDLVQTDIAGLSPAEIQYTRYVIVIVTNGLPDPVCHAGCEDDATACEDSLDNDGDGLVDLEDSDCAQLENYGVCNHGDQVPPGSYVDMGGICPDYNLEANLMTRVLDLTAFVVSEGVGEVVIHARLVSNPVAEIEPLCGVIGWEQMFKEASAQLTAMATAGGGTYTFQEPDQPFMTGVDTSPLMMP